MNRPIDICGAGCCLVDRIYPDIRFDDPEVTRYLSRKKGDGGLYPGRLVFAEQFETFSGAPLPAILEKLGKGRAEPILNVGGPAIVALIHAAQLLHGTNAELRFYGARGNDQTGKFLKSRLEQTPVNLENFTVTSGATPSTIVLSDPSYNEGHGERMFINDIGVSWDFGPKHLNERFFKAHVVVFGGTALVPSLHDGLTSLLARAKQAGCITMVNTVYDFRSELRSPGQRWPMGNDDESYRLIDLIIMDREEALHLSATSDLSEAGRYFIKQGVSSMIITDGTRSTHCFSNGRLFQRLELQSFPVSSALIEDLRQLPGGDTTGCGDNFVGGVLAALAWQLQENKGLPNLLECLAWGTVSGGYCCFHVGGTLIEMEPGEKLELIRPYYHRYKNQIIG